ncbi:MAG: glycoside hydrolase family 27 protein [Acidobacteriaceae bacterium]|nr:glycoside hydrolase family 27 protein [Acidobacteriaceae bacterium]MBV9763337.1 glycoside hydrolase family 27 protein [Acidobacteriaceae bacterium]
MQHKKSHHYLGSFRIAAVAAVALAVTLIRTQGQNTPLAPSPPMGWNSWDSYGLSVTQNEFEANADWMAQHLRRYGWEYAVVDEGWYLENPEAKPGEFHFAMDAQGRYTPAPNRFPLAAANAGFSKLAQWAHARKLKFGIHIIRGIPREAVQKNLPIAGSEYRASDAANKSDTCAWNADNYGIKNNAAGQAYYDSLAALYAGWGLDFVKVDCIASPYLGDEIRMFSDALRKTNRPIVLSLSPGPAPVDKVDDLRKYAQMWRISGDIWDHWKQWPKQDWSQGLLGQFQLTAKWAPFVESGHWPDADMLPLGYIGPRPGQGKARKSDFTQDEQKTLMTLWVVFRSPLIAGSNLTQLDDGTTSLLTNEEVISVDQHSHGGRPVVNEEKKTIWIARPDSGKGAYIALFNLDDEQQAIEFPLQTIGLNGVSFHMRDLWGRKDLGSTDVLKVNLASHASALFRVQ